MMFNPDMDGRLRDLHAACEAGDPLAMSYAAAFGDAKGVSVQQPARIIVKFGERTVVLPLTMVLAVASQLEANGFLPVAAEMRALIPA